MILISWTVGFLMAIEYGFLGGFMVVWINEYLPLLSQY